MYRNDVSKGACSPPLEAVLEGSCPSRRPVWFMRQAGRYLPEYRSLRLGFDHFLDFCYTPSAAARATLQPIERYDLDAAIIFSDILVIPDLYGVLVEFKAGEGPCLSPVGEEEVVRLRERKRSSKVEAIFEALSRVRSELSPSLSLIGFCGAPWTVASYMVEGGKSVERENLRLLAYRREPWLFALMDWLVDVSIDFLCGQVEAGANVLQIFDTWAVDLSEELRPHFCYDPILRIVKGVKSRFPKIPIIGFARGLGVAQIDFVTHAGVDACGVEAGISRGWIRDNLLDRCPVQGNLDPVCLMAGGEALDGAVRNILEAFPKDRHIFNLGHGIKPGTDPEHLSKVISLIRDYDH